MGAVSQSSDYVYVTAVVFWLTTAQCDLIIIV